MVFKTILVPYDGSPMSDKALDKAVELANIIKKSRIMIIHVVPEIPMSLLGLAIFENIWLNSRILQSATFLP